MAKNTISTPVKDGVKADNSGLSSNKIEEIAGKVSSLVIDDNETSTDKTFSSNKILSLLRG